MNLDAHLRKLKQRVAGVTTEAEKQSLLKEIASLMDETRKRIEEAKTADPFWWFEPSDGKITDDGYKLLEKYLKPEDMPVGELDNQIDVLKDMSPIKGASGGNQSGKSTVGAIKAYIQATGEVPESMKGWYPAEALPKTFPQYIRVVGESAHQLVSTVIPTYQKWCPRKYLKNGSWEDSFSSQNRILLLTNGSMVEFMTNEQSVEVFQGPRRDLVVYDEEPRQDIHKENLLRFATAERVNFLFCWTPTKGISWATELFTEGSDEKGNLATIHKLCSVTNKKVNVSVLDDILSQLTSYDEIKMRLLGEFVSLSGLVYGKLFNEKIHVIEPFPVGRVADEGQTRENLYNFFVVRGIDPHLVKPSAAVELAIDRDGNRYVIGSYLKDADTEEFKKDLADRARGYRLGWSIFDKSSDSTIKIFGDRNVYLEMTRGKNAVPAPFKSDKYTGSIVAGVDDIKKSLKLNEKTKKPSLFIFNTPENKPLIHAMKFMERDTYANEDEKGKKDKIKEGPHDLHACLRYIHQRPVRWMPPQESMPEPAGERFI